MSKNRDGKAKKTATSLVVVGGAVSIRRSLSDSKTILAAPKRPIITSKPLDYNIAPFAAEDITPTQKDLPKSFKPYSAYSKYQD